MGIRKVYINYIKPDLSEGNKSDIQSSLCTCSCYLNELLCYYTLVTSSQNFYVVAYTGVVNKTLQYNFLISEELCCRRRSSDHYRLCDAERYNRLFVL